MKVLVFDTETTGLPKVKNASIYKPELWPRVVQLSFLVYDVADNIIDETFNSLIALPPGVTIEPGAQNVHGISMEMTQTRGMEMVSALDRFDAALQNCDLVVGHNLSFDKRLLMVEANRLKRPQFFTTNGKRKPEFCTMKESVEVCRIPAQNQQTGETYFKYPKLAELHDKLFDYVPMGLHDSMADVLVCLRCFMQLKHSRDLIYDSRHFAAAWRTHCIPMT